MSSSHGTGAVAGAASGAGPPPARGAGGGGAGRAPRRPRRPGRGPATGERVGRRRGGPRLAPPRRPVADALACRGDVLRAGAAAAADDLRPLLAPRRGHIGVLGGVDGLVEAPPVGGVVAEV